MNSSSVLRVLSGGSGFWFKLLAGLLAGLALAVEVSVLLPLVWAIGGDTGDDVYVFFWLALRSTARVVPFLVAAGAVCGGLATLIASIAPAINRLALYAMLPFWALGSYVYAVSGKVHVTSAIPYLLINITLCVVLAVAAYLFWLWLVQCLRQGRARTVVYAVLGMGVGLWFPMFLCLV